MAMSCGVGFRHCLDPTLLWLWHRLIGSLAWELPYAVDVALKSKIRSSRRGTVETNSTRNHEVASSIPGLTQWVKDLAWLCAVVWVADEAWILHCCGCGVGWRLPSSDSTPSLLGTSICGRCSSKKTTKTSST